MRWWIAFLMVMAAALAALPVVARGDGEPAPICAAASSPSEALSVLAADASRWRCGSAALSLAPERTVLRLPVNAGAQPASFSTRASLFEGLSIAIVEEGRIVAQRDYRASALAAGPHGDTLAIALPRSTATADAVLVAFDLPTSRALFTQAALSSHDETKLWNGIQGLLIAAIVCGMLAMPLAFNFAYYRMLRQSFVLWHLILSLALLTQCLLNSGLLSHFVLIPLPLHAKLGTFSFGLGVASAAAFCAAFIEPHKLNPRLRRGLYHSAAWVIAVTMLHLAFPNVARSVQTPLYFAAFLPVLALFTAVMIDGWRRGSRAVRYQLVAWLPFILVGLIRIITMLIPSLSYHEAAGLFQFAMVVESVTTSLGVADRFMLIKRQRDRAIARAQSLELLTERDHMTGLYNRRALDGRLGDFAMQRFTGFALFDLDNFKRVNDSHGHATGDAVLRTVAGVLDGHEDSVALRLGGEEFLLLLHGDHVAERVERLREALPVRIAREVAELEILVTASAGLIEAAPKSSIGSDFTALYRAADELLYEAKHNGRNLLAAKALRAEPAVAAPVEGAAAA